MSDDPDAFSSRDVRRAMWDCLALLAPHKATDPIAAKIHRTIDLAMERDYQAFRRENFARVAGKTACGKK